MFEILFQIFIIAYMLVKVYCLRSSHIKDPIDNKVSSNQTYSNELPLQIFSTKKTFISSTQHGGAECV